MQDGSIHEYVASGAAENITISSLPDGGEFIQQILNGEAALGVELAGWRLAASAVPAYVGAGVVGTADGLRAAKKEEESFDLNNDGKVDNKDRSIAAKVLGSKRGKKKK
jgi:hypothetical protein